MSSASNAIAASGRRGATPWAGGGRRAARIGWSLWAAVATLWGASLLLIDPAPGAPADSSLWHVAFLVYGAMGAVIVTRRPGNRVGWLFLVVGTFDALSAAVRAIAATGGTDAFAASTVNVADWLQSWLWAPSMGALVLLVYVFPDGRMPTGRWRWGARATIAATAVLLVVQPFMAWPYRGLILYDRVPADATGQIVSFAAFGVLVASLIVSALWLVVRFRRARGVERLQLKWFVYGVAVLVVAMVLDMFVLEALGIDPAAPLREAVYWAFVLPPVSAAVAVLRHRLYEIDRLINRTVVYTTLTVVLAAAYVGAITAMRAVTADFTGDTAFAVAASTLAVAALFQPARRRIQDAVDRRFNRARYDASAAIARFSTRLRDEVDLETLRRELIATVGATMQPARTSLWLREVRE